MVALLAQQTTGTNPMAGLFTIAVLILVAIATSRHPKHLRTLGYIIFVMLAAGIIGGFIGYGVAYANHSANPEGAAGTLTALFVQFAGLATSIQKLMEAKKSMQMPRS